MKKFIVVALGLMIMMLGSAVYAQKLDFKASGFLDVISEYTRNVPNNPVDNLANFYGPRIKGFLLPTAAPTSGNAYDKKRAYMESRGRLKFDAVMEKNLMGTIFFEIDSSRWGERAPTAADQRNAAGEWGADRGAVEVKNVYITFGVPNLPVTIQAGIHPMAFRPDILAYTDGTGVTVTTKIDPASIKLVWMKAAENEDFASDDADVYGLDANVKAGPVTVGGYVLYYNMNTYPINFTGDAVANRANIGWYGLYANGKLGPVNLSFDFAYDRGKVEDARDIAVRARDIKYRGWATILNIDYPWEKFNFGGYFVYGSGADTRKTNLSGTQRANDPTTPLDEATTSNGAVPSKVGSYVVPPNAEHGVNDMSLIFYSSGGGGVNRAGTGYCGSSPVALSGGAWGGSWAIKLYGKYQATPWYKITLQGLYIGDTTKHGNTIGTARKADGKTLRDDSTIGWEFNLINEIKIYKNLTWFVSGGLLFAGDAMDYYVNPANPAESPKNPWIITTKLLYVF